MSTPADDPKIKEASGSGTLADPKVIWWKQPPPKSEAKREAVEAICLQVCRRAGFAAVWIRGPDHKTTMRGPTGQKRREPTDPHITVYMSREFKPYKYEFEGHIYVHYDFPYAFPLIPSRLATRAERWDPPNGPNPELWHFDSVHRYYPPGF